jgi:uncharacterized membrane protein HdeD (DUF308 family)
MFSHPSQTVTEHTLKNEIDENSLWLLLVGLFLVACGVVSIIIAPLATYVAMLIVGVLVFAGGITHLLHAVNFWRRHWLGLVLHILLGLVYCIAGVFFWYRPLAGAFSLTILLASFLVVMGMFRIITAATQRKMNTRWTWTLFSGIINLLLGMLVLMNWPSTGLWFIGLIIGIDLLSAGISLVMLSMTMPDHIIKVGV